MFLYNYNNRRANGIKAVHCGLCPEQNHHRALMRYHDAWSAEIKMTNVVYKCPTIDTSEWNIYRLVYLSLATMCDICQVTFHHFDYLFLCETSEYNQHSICLPCMNRHVLENK